MSSWSLPQLWVVSRILIKISQNENIIIMTSALISTFTHEISIFLDILFFWGLNYLHKIHFFSLKFDSRNKHSVLSLGLYSVRGHGGVSYVNYSLPTSLGQFSSLHCLKNIFRKGYAVEKSTSKKKWSFLLILEVKHWNFFQSRCLTNLYWESLSVFPSFIL